MLDGGDMATYKEIQNFIQDKYGFAVKTCWIAHVKEMCGIPTRVASNRYSLDNRKYPCPKDKINTIKDASAITSPSHS